MPEIAGWIASAATMIAAMMTAANLGTRVTGWGFVVFTIGSIAWASVGLMSGQPSLAITNAFLFIVNLFGIWRWLGRQARYEQGRIAATQRSQTRQHIPTLFSASALVGANVQDENGDTVGTIVDAMFGCGDTRLNYVVLSKGGIGGAGETLRAVSGEHFRFEGDTFLCRLNPAEVATIPVIETENWPTAAQPLPAVPYASYCQIRESQNQGRKRKEGT